MTWFKTIFGFNEGDYEWTRAQFVHNGETLVSRANDRTLQTGTFTTPTLQELRAKAKPRGRISTLRHEVIGDVLPVHAQQANAGATFQVASQFNCLEFISPDVTPLHGVTDYANDPTQGPACSLAAAGATVVRNYFALVDGQSGQTATRQINNLATLAAALPSGPYWTVHNGYTFSSRSQLQKLAPILNSERREEWMSHMRIGWHRQVGVTFRERYVLCEYEQLVSQTFCSAISCAYTDIPRDAWRPLACLTLDAAYEATLLAAAIDRDEGKGSGTVWLTLLGGGVFGNDDQWICAAIARAIERTRDLGLDIRLAHYRALKDPFRSLTGP